MASLDVREFHGKSLHRPRQFGCFDKHDGEHEERLARIVADVTGPIRACAATLIALQDGRTLAPKSALEEVFAGGAWEENLAAISAVHRGEHLPAGATRRLYGEVLRLLVALDERAFSLS